MTVEVSFPWRLTAIDDLTRGGHRYLRRTEVFRYLGEHKGGRALLTAPRTA